jgi:1-acyl-sn-glycerol-3-phosphate acyltransferase
MIQFRAACKIFITFSVICSFVLFSLPGRLITRDEHRRRKFSILVTSGFSKFLLYVAGIKFETENNDVDLNDKNYLIVSNHLSYIDILIIASLFPSVFITSNEIKHSKFLGLIAKLGGCIFIERCSVKDLLNDIETVSNVLRVGFSVVLFPEGTSTNGERVLPFKRAFFESSIKSGVDIRPVCIKYLEINNEIISPQNRDIIFWYGDMTFFSHLIRLLLAENIKIKIVFPGDMKIEPGLNGKEAARLAYESICRAYYQ